VGAGQTGNALSRENYPFLREMKESGEVKESQGKGGSVYNNQRNRIAFTKRQGMGVEFRKGNLSGSPRSMGA